MCLLVRWPNFSMRAVLFFSVMRWEDSTASTSSFSSGSSSSREPDEVAVLRAFDADDVQAEVHEQLDIAVHIFPGGLDAMSLPKTENIRASCVVVLICLLQEKL